MTPAQQESVGQAGFAAGTPVLNMVCVDVPRVRTAGEAAAAVTGGERATQRRGYRPAFAADIQRGSLRVSEDRNDPRIAEEAARRFSGDAGLLLLADQRGGVDLDENLDGRTIQLVTAKRRLRHAEDPIEARFSGNVAGL